ncbi:MAG: sulfatase, partial [Gemmatimonadetes bacterium]|nr:sulfatase [Gemmatimonadota bacterium]
MSSGLVSFARGRVRAGAAVLVGLVIAAFAVDRARSGAEANAVILLVVDTLRADHLGCYGDPEVRTPGIDRLARNAAQFRCSATAPWTLPAAGSIMTGRLPSGHGADFPRRRLSGDVPLVAEDFQGAGYRTAAFISHTMVGAEFGFARGFDVFDESNALGHEHVSSDAVTGLATDWLGGSGTADDDFFLFLHYFDPHYNYVAHENWTAPGEYGGRIESGMDIWKLRRLIPYLGDGDVDYLRRLYRGEIHLLDGSLRALFRDLERRGLADRATVILTADHGEEFLEHGWLGHTRNLREVLLDIPMIVRSPGRVAPGLRPERATQLDVRPTLRAA